MYLAVQAACEARPSVWQRSEAFEDAYLDFCKCIDNILRLQVAVSMFGSVAQGIAVEMAVADTILTTDLDELIERFAAVDEKFVEDYTAARSLNGADEKSVPPPAQPAS